MEEARKKDEMVTSLGCKPRRILAKDDVGPHRIGTKTLPNRLCELRAPGWGNIYSRLAEFSIPFRLISCR
jgi:hypothetical protein